jgi:ketosteroid isomerase-like protein
MITTLNTFFHSIDEHAWEKMRTALADTVLLDSSPVGRPRRDLSGDQLVALSRSVGGGFQQTVHHFGNIRSQESGDQGEIDFDLMALHYLPVPSGDPMMTLFRTINTRLLRQPSGPWVITAMETRSERTAGNAGLLSLVQQKQDRAPKAPGAHKPLIDRFFSSLERRDAEGFDALWTDEALWRLPFMDRVVNGRPAIREYFKEIVTTIPGQRFEHYYQDTDHPDITLAGYTRSSGGDRPSEVCGAVFYFHDGRIEKLEDYRLEQPSAATPV